MKSPRISLLSRSVKAIILGTINPDALQELISEVEQEATGGKLTKAEVGYLPVHPPPGLYNYKCSNCHWWEQGNCKVVQGNISPNGWCFIWVPANKRQ